MAAAVQRDDVEAVVGQDLAGVLPGVPVLAAAVQHQNARSIGGPRSCHDYEPLVGDKGEPLGTGKLDSLAERCARKSRAVLSVDRTLTLPR